MLFIFEIYGKWNSLMRLVSRINWIDSIMQHHINSEKINPFWQKNCNALSKYTLFCVFAHCVIQSLLLCFNCELAKTWIHFSHFSILHMTYCTFKNQNTYCLSYFKTHSGFAWFSLLNERGFLINSVIFYPLFFYSYPEKTCSF